MRKLKLFYPSSTISLVFGIVGLLNSVIAQGSISGPILSEIRDVESDSAKTALYLQLANDFKRIDTDSSRFYSNIALRSPGASEFKILQANALNMLGVSDYYDGKYGSALENFRRALTIYEAEDLPLKVSSSLSNIASIYRIKGESQKALAIFERVLEISRNLGIPTRIGVVYNSIGNIHVDQGNSEKAIRYFSKALALSEAPETIGLIQDNLGKEYLKVGRLDSAKHFFSSAFKIQVELPDSQGLINSLYGLGNVDVQEGNLTEGLQKLKRAYNLSIRISPYMVAETAKSIAEVLMENGEDEEASRYWKAHYHYSKQVEEFEINEGPESNEESKKPSTSWYMLIIATFVVAALVIGYFKLFPRASIETEAEPVVDQSLEEKESQEQSHSTNKNINSIELRGGVVVAITDISYIQGNRGYVDIYFFKDGQIVKKLGDGSIGKWVNRLQGNQNLLVRVHRSYIVNAAKVTILDDSKSEWCIKLPSAEGRDEQINVTTGNLEHFQRVLKDL